MFAPSITLCLIALAPCLADLSSDTNGEAPTSDANGDLESAEKFFVASTPKTVTISNAERTSTSSDIQTSTESRPGLNQTGKSGDKEAIEPGSGDLGLPLIGGIALLTIITATIAGGLAVRYYKARVHDAVYRPSQLEAHRGLRLKSDPD